VALDHQRDTIPMSAWSIRMAVKLSMSLTARGARLRNCGRCRAERWTAWTATIALHTFSRFRKSRRSVDHFWRDCGRLAIVKRESVRLLTEPYPTREDAETKIKAGLKEYYTQNYPDVASARAPEIDRAAATVADIYLRNIFPA